MSLSKQIMSNLLEVNDRLINRIINLVRKTYRIWRPMRKDYRGYCKMNLAHWLLYHERHIAFNQCYWIGVRALKNPLDMWVYQEIIYEIKPDIVIEIGSAEGGSALYFAHLLDILGNGSVISIDIDRSNYHLKHHRIVTITGDSSSPETIKQVQKHCDGRSTLVIHDGDHTREKVLKDLNLYSKFVSLNSYFIVEDGIIDLFKPGDGIGSPNDGPLKAIEEFLGKNPNFVIDKERERYLLTYNPNGYLKRIH